MMNATVAGSCQLPFGIWSAVERGPAIRRTPEEANPVCGCSDQNSMAIVREEIFVRCSRLYSLRTQKRRGADCERHPGDLKRRRVSKRIRSGNVHIDGAQPDSGSYFGAYKQS